MFVSDFSEQFDSYLVYESFELSRRYRQHIYQALCKKVWSIGDNVQMMVMDENGAVQLKQASYLMVSDNMFSWMYLVNVPNLTEEAETQIGGLYDMLDNIDDSDLDFSPLTLWMEQMEFEIKEVYPLLLYIWFMLDLQLPASPYKFIKKPKTKPLPKPKVVPKEKSKAQEAASQKQQKYQKQNVKNQKNQKKGKQSKKKQKAQAIDLSHWVFLSVIVYSIIVWCASFQKIAVCFVHLA